MKTAILLVVTSLSLLMSACSTTQTAPTSLDSYSKTVRAGFVSFKQGGMRHRAFAVGRIGRRDFFGFGHRYKSVEKAEERALEECYKSAGRYKDKVTCFIYFSE